MIIETPGNREGYREFGHRLASRLGKAFRWAMKLMQPLGGSGFDVADGELDLLHRPFEIGGRRNRWGSE